MHIDYMNFLCVHAVLEGDVFQTVLLGATQHQIATKSSVPFIQPLFPHTHNALVYTHCFHFLVLFLLIELYIHHSVYMRSMVTGLKNVYCCWG